MKNLLDKCSCELRITKQLKKQLLLQIEIFGSVWFWWVWFFCLFGLIFILVLLVF